MVQTITSGMMSHRISPHHRPLSKKGAMARLRSLCCAGLDPITIAPDIFTLLHQLIPNAACALFLTQPNGIPYAFYHEAPDEAARQLFQNHPELFLSDKHNNMCIYELDRPKCNGLEPPPHEYFSSNTYQYLVRPSGHHHKLEVRLEANHVAAGVLSLFRESGCGFKEADIPVLTNAARYIEFALKGEFDPNIGQNGIDMDSAMIVISAEGVLLYMTDLAVQLLQLIPLQHNFWKQGQHLPDVCTNVIRQLQSGHDLPHYQISIPKGLLHVRAEWLNPVNQINPMIALHLKQVIPKSLACWQIIQASDLSPQQAEVAYLLVTGATKPMIRAQLGISDAVLKDCIMKIYQCFAVHSVIELIQQTNQRLLGYMKKSIHMH